MKYLAALLALTALAACGVDGAPVQPAKASGGKNATAVPEPGKWISGTVSAHTATTI